MMRKLNFVLSVILLGATLSAQEVKIRVQDFCQSKPIYNAKVFLEGKGKPPVEAKFDSKQKCYVFVAILEGYNTIAAYHRNYAPALYSAERFPTEITLKLQCENNIVSTDSVNEKGYTKHYSRSVDVRDNYKILIALKNSYRMPFEQVKKKIDSLVSPFGLEYISDAVPEINFFKVDGLYVPQFKNDWYFSLTNPKKSVRDIVRDSENYNQFAEADGIFDMGDNSKKCHYVLAYRKKDKKPFDADDETLEQAKKKLTQLQFGKLIYRKFLFIYPELDLQNPWNFLTCSNLQRYDSKMMNYQFIRRYKNDSTRVYFMDFTLNPTYLDKNGINNRGDMTVIAVPEYEFHHDFLLDRPKREFKATPANVYYLDMGN